MINLLPAADQQTIKKIYRLRLVACYSLLSSGLLLIFVFLIGCLYYVLSVQTKAEQTTLASLQNNDKAIAGNAPGLTQENLNQVADQITADKKNLPISQIIKALADSNPAGIKINKLVLKPKENNELSINIKGITADRETLLKFIDQLKNKAGFLGVVSPYSNLVKKTNAEFEISLNAALPAPTK